ncbi:MAG TPA: hypothetical protein VGD50_00555 [Candidatus Baltobacteraceae bacterium]
MRSQLPVGLAIVVSIFFSSPARAAVIPFGPAGAGDQVAYQISNRGVYWQDSSNGYDGTLTITREDQTHLDAAWVAGGDTGMASGGPNGLGGIESSTAIEWMDPFNVVGQLLFPIASDVHGGLTWSAELPVHVNPGELVQVPVSAEATSDKSHTLTVAFSGHRSGLYSYSGFIVPIDVSVTGTLDVVSGKFTRCAYDVREAVHLSASQQQTLSWSFSIAPQ